MVPEFTGTFGFRLLLQPISLNLYNQCSFIRVIHPVKYYRDYLNYDLRPDGRDLTKFRPVVINVDSIGTTDGSAIVKVGNTTVVCGIKVVRGAFSPAKHLTENNYFNVILSGTSSAKGYST